MSKGDTWNVPRSVVDPSYRYKMPKIEWNVQSKGINIRTYFTNLEDVAKALRRPTIYMIKFFAIQKGAQSIFKQEGNETIAILKGSYDENDILPLLDLFIDKFVLCSKCGFPQANLEIKEKMLYGNCIACKNYFKMDHKHKLTSYIIKNPPKNFEGFEGVDEGGIGKGRKIGKKVKLDKQTLSDIEELKPKIQADSLEIGSSVLQEVLEHFTSYYERICKKKKKSTTIVEHLYRCLRAYQIPFEKSDRMDYLIFNVIFDESFPKQIPRMSKLVKTLSTRSKRSKVTQHAFLLNLQHIFCSRFSSTNFTALTGTFFMEFYKLRIFTEQFLLKFKTGQLNEILAQHFLYNEGHMNKVKKDAEGFLTWVENEANESSEEESGSADDDQDSSDGKSGDEDNNSESD